MLRKISLILGLRALSIHAIAQTETEKEKKSNLSFSGSVDGYFRADLNQNVTNNRTSFTNSTGKIALGMASGKVDYTLKKFSFTADLGIGNRAKEFAYNDKGALSIVKQLFASYAAADWLKLTAGTWATHVGYELLDPAGNKNYSMSYLFSYGPFLHTGVKSEFSVGKTGLMLGIANPTDYRSAPTPNKKSLLLQFTQELTDDIKLYLNYVGAARPTDQAKTRQIDLVLTAKLSEKLNAGFNSTITRVRMQENGIYNAAGTWGGIATYLSYAPKEKLSVNLRTERFNDKSQLAAMGLANYGASVFANTLSVNFTIGPVTMVPEVRLESASNKIYATKLGTERSTNASLLVGAYYTF